MNLRGILSQLITGLAFINASGQEPLKEIRDFGNNPGNLRMFVHHPTFSRQSPAKMPLVVVLHGCLQDAEAVALASGWNKLADSNGFVILYPQQKMINNPSGCFNWFRKKDILKDKGEVASIRQMIRFATDSFSIDTGRIFIYGLSAGAALSVAMLANYPGIFRAGAIFAGAPFMTSTSFFESMGALMKTKDKSPEIWGRLVQSQNPEFNDPYPKLVIMHGLNDRKVDFGYSIQLVRQWSWLHKTDTIPDIIDRSFSNNPDICRYQYVNSNNQPVIFLYAISRLGHALPVYPGNGKDQGGSTGSFAKDIHFFSTRQVALDWELISIGR